MDGEFYCWHLKIAQNTKVYGYCQRGDSVESKR